MATITVQGNVPHPDSERVTGGERVMWTDPGGGTFTITFRGRTPLEWQSNSGNPVSGTVRDDVGQGNYKYRVGDSLSDAGGAQPFADPELIVSGGLGKDVGEQPEPASTPGRARKATTRTKATKRKATKRKATKRKATKRKATKRKATKRKTTKRKTTKRKAAKRTKRAAKKR